MARKGNAKVRTGCLTCKVRKVKCDEGKPCCKRCTSTGRNCDGYVLAQASSALSWYRPRHLFPNVNSTSERRCLQFFCVVAAPVLAGPLDPYFWTHLILQFSHMEPAVRHSVIAVGSLYEQVHGDQASSSLPADENVALVHYNAAIKHLKTMENESLVLLVCILFVCIEFLRGNRDGATAHCQHGITILKRIEQTFPWVKTYLSPLFRRLSILPFFFTVTDHLDPNLLCLDDAIPSFLTYGDAQFYLDGILGRTVRLIRRGDVYRLGYLKHKPMSPDLIAEQSHTRTLLDEWHLSFTKLIFQSHDQESPPVEQCNMLIRYLTFRVWVETAFEFEQTMYDKYIHLFRSVVDLAATVKASEYGAKPIKFTFEMGFIPVLYFATIKCRCLKTRLRALSLMRDLGAFRENLWDLVTMFISAKRIVEIEHGATLTDDGQLSDEPSCPGLPPDVVRVRDSSTERKPFVETVDGVEKEGRLGGFFLRTVEGEIYVRTEFLPLPSWA